MTKTQCVQFISAGPKGGTRQCRKTGTHYMVNHPNKHLCTQHARSYDQPIPRAAR